MSRKTYDCIIIGAGIAGLQAAIQLGRYLRHVLVIDNQNGRSNLCRGYHNILGWPEGVSGETLRELGKQQATSLGILFQQDTVSDVKKNKNEFTLQTVKGETYHTKTVLISTGVKDNIPKIKDIEQWLGRSIYVCPDCDGYEVKDKQALVLGTGKTGANLSLTLTYFTNRITFINHGGKVIEQEAKEKLQQKNITIIDGEIEAIVGTEEFEGVQLANGQVINGDKAFIGFGGNKVHSEIASKLGVELLENKHILVDPRTKETNITNVWAAGDVVAHSEQVTIAMADGCQAAIWIHKRLLQGI
ncbi:NAD(P)/FAD-dependent oxidoreductase [Metabacillus malikii]|uniref:Thioredoxin reductase n=1 Tax=Metabacillus malikii TaxID=1504265 RepID=A0ABT9ZEV1_9BACI|nr:NAD(P)/FAD-dependent oxidoreductase [Metabacillus malikii]MDQ0230799.1 thioredoxin reductase [Metabacillus malikii]